MFGSNKLTRRKGDFWKLITKEKEAVGIVAWHTIRTIIF